MLCPRCNTELPDSAVICSQCGSQVSALRPQPPTFSYLPAGTPQWPTTVPPNLPYQTPGMPSMYAGAGSALDTSNAANTPGRSARKRGSLGVPAILLLFIVSILVGGGLTYGILALQGQSNASAQKPLPVISLTPRPATTPSTPTTQSPTPSGSSNQLPTPTSFKTTSSSDLGFSMQYPSDWVQDPPQQSTTGNKDIAFHPQQQLPVYLQVGQISATNSATVNSTSEVNQANIDGFGSSNSLTNEQNLTNTPKTRTIGGASWDEQDTTFADSNGNTIHVVSLTVKHTRYYYNILYFAPGSVYDEAMSKYYTQMLNSFLFTA